MVEKELAWMIHKCDRSGIKPLTRVVGTLLVNDQLRATLELTALLILKDGRRFGEGGPI